MTTTALSRRLAASQPHEHPAPGRMDGRGNCPRCADYNPARYGWMQEWRQRLQARDETGPVR